MEEFPRIGLSEIDYVNRFYFTAKVDTSFMFYDDHWPDENFLQAESTLSPFAQLLVHGANFGRQTQSRSHR